MSFWDLSLAQLCLKYNSTLQTQQMLDSVYHICSYQHCLLFCLLNHNLSFLRQMHIIIILLESDYIWCLSTLMCCSLLMFLINECVSDMIKIILKNMNINDKCFQDVKEMIKTDIKWWKLIIKRAAFIWIEQWCQLLKNMHMYDEIDSDKITSVLKSQYQMHWLNALFSWVTDCVLWSSCFFKEQRYLKCMCAFR